MIAIDTNILLRYLVEDEPARSALAIDLIENRLTGDEPGFLSIPVLIEVSWVLERRYRRTASEIREIITGLLEAAQFAIERPELVEAALAHNHPDFADAIIHETAKSAGCTRTFTFDHGFARLSSVELLQ